MKKRKLLTSLLSMGALAVTVPIAVSSCQTNTNVNNGDTSETPDTPSNGDQNNGSDTNNPGNGSEDNGSSDGDTIVQTATFKWSDTLSSFSGVTVDSNGVPTITLSQNLFAGSNINSNSTYDQLMESLSPKDLYDNSLFSTLSKQINDVDKGIVTLKTYANNVSFNYLNTEFGNTLTVSYVITPNDGVTASETTLTLNIKNFNDATNGKGDVYIDETKAKSALSSNGISATSYTMSQDNSVLTIGVDSSTTLSQLLLKLNNDYDVNQLTKDKLSKAILAKDGVTNYDLTKMEVSYWALSKDKTEVFTRVVVPTTDSTKYATLYIVYKGFSKDPDTKTSTYWWNRNALAQTKCTTVKLSNNNGSVVKGFTPVFNMQEIGDVFKSAGITKDSSLKWAYTQIKTKDKLPKLIINEFILNLSSSSYRAGITATTYNVKENKAFKVQNNSYKNGNGLDVSFRASDNTSRYVGMIMYNFGSNGF